MSEVAKGFRRRRFYHLPDSDKRDLLKLMARVAEQAYRRGVQQGAGLAGKPSFRGDLWEWRFRPSLDLSPWIDRPTTTTSLDRLEKVKAWLPTNSVLASIVETSKRSPPRTQSVGDEVPPAGGGGISSQAYDFTFDGRVFRKEVPWTT